VPTTPVLRRIGRIFATGLLTVLPIVITVYFTLWVLGVLEKFFGKQVMLLIPDEWYRTGMGLVMAVVVVFLVGLLMSDLLFRRLFALAEMLLLRVPLVRSVYGAMRDLLGLFAQHKEPALQVVAIELGGARFLGFVTRSEFSDLPAGIGKEDEVAVYLPMSYQIGGYTVMVPKSATKPVEMSREDAMKWILTAGLQSASATPTGAGAAPETPGGAAPAPARTPPS
jgi:uncharacterized membrane protein